VRVGSAVCIRVANHAVVCMQTHCSTRSHPRTVPKTCCGADSLVMAHKACAMADAGCKAVCVLGVDFMSENVRAILDDAGHRDVAVYRMAADEIGCSLAEAAESPAYERYLAQAAAQPRSMHVVYINTSMRTKAEADAAVPTVTCTSSNVVQTVLQGFAQVRCIDDVLSC
jgi:quinolinate synthase